MAWSIWNLFYLVTCLCEFCLLSRGKSPVWGSQRVQWHVCFRNAWKQPANSQIATCRIPYRNVQRLTNLNTAEITDVFSTVQKVQKMLAKQYFKDANGDLDGKVEAGRYALSPQAFQKPTLMHYQLQCCTSRRKRCRTDSTPRPCTHHTTNSRRCFAWRCYLREATGRRG